MTERGSWRKIRFFEARETGLVLPDSSYWVNPLESDLHRLVMSLYSFLRVCQYCPHHLGAFNFLPWPSIICLLPDLCLCDSVASYGKTELFVSWYSLEQYTLLLLLLFLLLKSLTCVMQNNLASTLNLCLWLCLVAMTEPFALRIWRLEFLYTVTRFKEQ